MSGYNKLAAMMGAYPEIAVFRRFAALNSQNALLLQAEIMDLEANLRECEKDDETSGDPTRNKLGRNWFELSHSVRFGQPVSQNDPSGEPQPGSLNEQTPCTSESRQYLLLLELRCKLKEYNEAILQQVKMAKLHHPNPRDFRFLQRWMDDEEMGCIALLGNDRTIYEEPDLLDLLAIKPPPNESPLTVWLSDTAIGWLQYFILSPFEKAAQAFRLRLRRGSRPNADPETVEMQDVHTDASIAYRLDTMATSTRSIHHSQQGMLRLARVFAMCLSSVIPIIAIVILYYVKNTAKRLGIIAGFTAMFSLTLGLVTYGELVDVFAASAAFAAVQVVFIGTDSGGSKQTALGSI